MYLSCLIIFASSKFKHTREETAELTASRFFLLSCFLSCAPGFRGKNSRIWYLLGWQGQNCDICIYSVVPFRASSVSYRDIYVYIYTLLDGTS